MSAKALSQPRSRRAPCRALALMLALGCAACSEGEKDGETGDEEMESDPSVGSTRDPLRVALDDGELQGDLVGGARRFLKIPFAKPPLDALRWKAPVPNDPWTGLRHETAFPESCPQLMDQGSPASNQEDCLYLNVWSPSPAPSNAPVMVWIHGGGNFSGGTGIPIPSITDSLWYDGQFFAARQGVVLVTIQYRLGPLGFFAHPALANEGDSVGNQGLLDQRRALEWVKENIAKFGGDPGNVTIFGESAGSADVCYHVASPKSRGLFRRAISQSGGCTIRSVGPEQTLANIGTQMAAYGKAVGCAEGDGQLACLRELSVETLLASAMQPMPGAGGGFGGQWSFAAVLDGPNGFLPDTPQALFDRGEIADVDYLLGANNDEGTTFVWRATALTNEAEYMADLTSRFGDKAAEVAALYPASKFEGDFNAARARVVGDSGVGCSTQDTARRAVKAGLKVYMYNFNVWWGLAPELFKAGHAAEISHVFGAPYHSPTESEAGKAASQQVAEAMNGYWARFAESGDPNGAGAPAAWPAFTDSQDVRLQLDSEWKVLTNFRSEECAFWHSYAGVE